MANFPPARLLHAGGHPAHLTAKRITILNESSQPSKRQDAFSVLTAATGGTQFRFHKQSELEGAVATLGVELRSTYLLSYSPNSTEPGYHAIRIEVDVSGAKVFADRLLRACCNELACNLIQQALKEYDLKRRTTGDAP